MNEFSSVSSLPIWKGNELKELCVRLHSRQRCHIKAYCWCLIFVMFTCIQDWPWVTIFYGNTTNNREPVFVMGGPERGGTGRVSVQGSNTTISQSLTYMVEETCKGGAILIEWVGGNKVPY